MRHSFSVPALVLFTAICLCLLLWLSPPAVVTCHETERDADANDDDDNPAPLSFVQRLLQDGYLASPQVDATQEFPNSCLKKKGDRLVVVTPSSSSSSSSTKFKKGSAFLATDLCAMGHTAKDAPLVLSWALDAEGFSEKEMMKEAFEAFCSVRSTRTTTHQAASSSKSNRCRPPTGGGGDHQDDRIIASNGKKDDTHHHKNSNTKKAPPLRYIVFGNMCMSKSDKFIPNKRTPVFHKVLWSWFRAVTGRIVFLRRFHRPHRQQHDDQDADEEEQQKKIVELHFSDFDEQSGSASQMMCFENIVVRKENWRWLRSASHADQFRIALWSHFKVSDKNQLDKLTTKHVVPPYRENNDRSSDNKINVENNKKRCLLSTEDVAASPLHSHRHHLSLLMDSLRPMSIHHNHESMALSISEVEKRHLQGKNTNNNKFDGDGGGDDLALSLRSRFPSSVLPLRVTVLVRDEDRHFQEREVGHYIQQFFGPDLVDVKLEKFDSIKGDKHYKPPSHTEQLQILFDTDVLVAAHGAGLAAVLAMRPGTAVVEFFPHNFKYYMYEEAAQLSRVAYKRYESPIVWPKRCCSVSPLATSNFSKPMALNGLGARACKKCDTYVTPKSVTELVATAIRSVVFAHN